MVSLLIKGGITKLSELIIDTDKDWGVKRIKNLPDPVDGNEPALKETSVESKPPTGKYRVVNIYVDPEIGKSVVEYEDTPAP